MNEIEKTILLLLLLFCFISIPVITICHTNCNCSCDCSRYCNNLKKKLRLKSITKNDYLEIA